MRKVNSLNALGKKERRQFAKLGGKSLSVYEFVEGRAKGMGYVQCSLYPDFGGLFPTVENAMARARNIVRFHQRQQEFDF